MSKSRLSRRSFAATLAAGGSIGIVSAQQAAPNPNTSEQRHGTMAEVPPFQKPLTFQRAPAPVRVSPFPMTQVRLLPGTYHDVQEWNRGYVHRLTEDRLIHNFRVNAGLSSSAQPFGGWEEPKCELRGHFTGHYLSSAALLYASTGDSEIKARGDSMVAELAKCQQKLGGGYLSAFPSEFWDRLDARKKVWAPYYTIHKVMAGMLDMYTLAGNKQALQVLQGMAEWADHWTASKPEAHMQDILNTEYGGMNDILYLLARTTGENKWAQVGDRFTKKRFFNPLALRRDELRGLHVNTHIPQVIGSAQRYELSRDMRFHDVADFFWYEVTTARSYATGGTSNGEGWLTPPRQLAAELKRSVATAECCCAYNMLKLTRHLYSWTGDPRYFDYYERVMLNHRVGTIQPKSGYTQYYLSHTPGAWKTFNDEDKSFWCCTGTGVEEYAKLNDSIYWYDAQGVYVNLFIASELDWKQKGVKLRQETRFPDQQSTAVIVTTAKPETFSLRLRIPDWLESTPSVRVNGKMLDASAGPGSYLVITRPWKSGDRIEMDLPLQPRFEALPDDQSLRAFLMGPVVMAADLGTDGLTPTMIVGPNAPEDLKALDTPVLKDMKPGASPLAFESGKVAIKPLNSIFDRRYSIYWRVS